MDIEEIKKYSKNKIEADNLIKQVRQRIKETTWEKQNLREGFTETFKPLISQFEDPGEDSKKQNLFTQNKEMLQNQLALTEGIRANQKAITDGFSQFEKLAKMQKLPGVEDIEDEEEDEEDIEDEEDKDDQARAPTPTPSQAVKKPINIKKEDFDIFLNNENSQKIIKENGFEELPSYYFDKSIEELDQRIVNVESDLAGLNDILKNKAKFIYDKNNYYQAVSTAIKRGPNPETKKQIETFNTLGIYLKNLIDLYKLKKKEKEFTGQGLFFSPQELIRRLELLNGSLAAGNNGVLPEFIQIAHQLRDLRILTNNQLNTLLRKII